MEGKKKFFGLHLIRVDDDDDVAYVVHTPALLTHFASIHFRKTIEEEEVMVRCLLRLIIHIYTKHSFIMDQSMGQTCISICINLKY